MIGVDSVATSISAKAAKINTDKMVAGRNILSVGTRAREVGRPASSRRGEGVECVAQSQVSFSLEWKENKIGFFKKSGRW